MVRIDFTSEGSSKMVIQEEQIDIDRSLSASAAEQLQPIDRLLMKFKQESLQLVHFNQLLGKFTVSQEALNMIAALDRPLSIISVAGAYRTGKSYLLNELLVGRPKAFQVGETMNAQTKGLWLWGQPIPAEDEHGQPIYHLIVDSQGIGSTDQDFSHDCKLLLLVFYLSSTLIYNSLGVIDENALNNFREILEIQKHLGAGKQEESMPAFVWVLRDFALEMVDREGNALTEDEYLELSLQETQASTQAQLRKNNIRKAIKQFFQERHCFTMVRPILDEIKLQQLSDQTKEVLRPDFVSKMAKIRTEIFGKIAKPKRCGGVEINGVLLCRLIESYVTTINESSYPMVRNLWSIVCASSNNDFCNRLTMELEERVRGLKLPQEAETLKNTLREIEEHMLSEFSNKAFKNNQYYELVEEIKERAKTLRRLVKSKNQALNTDHDRQEIDVLYGRHVRPKLKQDGTGLREAVSAFVNALKAITPREKLLVDKFREVVLWLDGRRLRELQQKEGISSEMNRLKAELARLQQLEGIKDRHADLQRKFSDKLEDELTMKSKLSQLQDSNRQLQAALRKQKQHSSDMEESYADKEREYAETVGSLNSENKRLLGQLNKLSQRTSESTNKHMQGCFDKFDSERDWWKEREELYKKTIHDITERMTTAESALKEQSDRAAKQKKAYLEKERFFEQQVKQLKRTIAETKNSYEKTSETLTRNNNLLRAIENMKANENDASNKKERRSILESKQSNQEQSFTFKKAQQDLAQARSELRTANHRAEALQSQLAEQKRTYQKLLEAERPSNGLIEQNKDLVAKCKVLQMQIEKLQVQRSYTTQKMQATMQTLTKARNRDRTLYEQSIRKLLTNIDRKQMQVSQQIGY